MRLEEERGKKKEKVKRNIKIPNKEKADRKKVER